MLQHTTNINLKTVFKKSICDFFFPIPGFPIIYLNQQFVHSKKIPQAIHFISMICLSSLELKRERNKKIIKSKK